MLKEFRDFLMRGNVVDLAVAVIIGAAFGAVVTSLNKDVLMQLVAAAGGLPDFSEESVKLNGAEIRWGALVTAAISFVIIAAIIFFFVVKPINALQARFNEAEIEEDPVPTKDQELLREIRDLLARQAR